MITWGYDCAKLRSHFSGNLVLWSFFLFGDSYDWWKIKPVTSKWILSAHALLRNGRSGDMGDGKQGNKDSVTASLKLWLCNANNLIFLYY